MATEFGFKIYAVDFDGTIVTDKFPEIGEAIPAVQEFIKAKKAQGDKVILWTCRTENHLAKALQYCMTNGIFFDAVNDNLPEVKELYGGNTRKVFADYYLDDKNTIIVNDLGDSIVSLRLVPEGG